MTDWTSGWLTAAIQVTAVALPAAALVLCVGRRNPAAAASTAAVALLISALLTLAAFVPLPTGWTWAVPSEVAYGQNSDTDIPRAITEDGPRWDVRLLLSHLIVTDAHKSAAPWSWHDAGAAILAVICTFSTVGWLAGLARTWRLRRRSRPIDDTALSALTERLCCAFGISRPVALRESADIGSAATCGGWRPAILLSPDWRHWRNDDLRAVLAHELAHVRRRDFGWGVLARGCLAINAWHPLVRWLAAGLRLAQELAADAGAAHCLGGQDRYRQSLARMALRQDRLRLRGAVPSFGSNRSTLIRRMAMLNLDNRGRTRTRGLCWAMPGLLVAIGFSASALRGPAQSPSPPAEPAKLPAFDLGYLPENCDGFVAIRPSVLLGRPEMKPVVDRWSKMLHAAFDQMGLSGAAIPFDAIEQAIGPVELKTLSEEDRKKMTNGERHSLLMGILYVRMNRDFDWAAVLRGLSKTVPVKEKEPGVFELSAPLFGLTPLTLRTIDARTIVGTTATAEQVAKRRAELTERFGAALLAEANLSGLAMVIDNKSARWAELMETQPQYGAVMTALGKPNRMAACLNWGDCVAASFIADWDAPPSDMTKGQQTVCALLGAALGAAKPTNAADQKVMALASELLKSIQVRRDGKLVRAEFQSTVRWPDLFGSLMGNTSASVEVHTDESK